MSRYHSWQQSRKQILWVPTYIMGHHGRPSNLTSRLRRTTGIAVGQQMEVFGREAKTSVTAPHIRQTPERPPPQGARSRLSHTGHRKLGPTPSGLGAGCGGQVGQRIIRGACGPKHGQCYKVAGLEAGRGTWARLSGSCCGLPGEKAAPEINTCAPSSKLGSTQLSPCINFSYTHRSADWKLTKERTQAPLCLAMPCKL